jgi:hypothetical protein
MNMSVEMESLTVGDCMGECVRSDFQAESAQNKVDTGKPFGNNP